MSTLVAPHGGGSLKPLLLPRTERADELKRAETLTKVPLTTREASDLFMLAMGAYTPLSHCTKDGTAAQEAGSVALQRLCHMIRYNRRLSRLVVFDLCEIAPKPAEIPGCGTCQRDGHLACQPGRGFLT